MREDGSRGSGVGRWVLPAAAAVCAVVLALSTNVASSLVPDEWAMQHALWVWGATGVLGVLSVWLAVLAWRRGGTLPRRL